MSQIEIQPANVSGVTLGASKPLTSEEADLIAAVELCGERGLSLRETAETLGVGVRVVRQVKLWPGVLEEAYSKLQEARAARR